MPAPAALRAAGSEKSAPAYSFSAAICWSNQVKSCFHCAKSGCCAINCAMIARPIDSTETRVRHRQFALVVRAVEAVGKQVRKDLPGLLGGERSLGVADGRSEPVVSIGAAPAVGPGTDYSQSLT